MSKQGLAGKRQHVTCTVSQALEIVRSLESGESWCDCGFIQHWIINGLWYKEREGPFTIVLGTKWQCI